MPQLVTVTHVDFRWQVCPEHRQQLLGDDGLRLDEWLRAGQASVVKHGPHRTVYRVVLPGLDFYLKYYPVADRRAWLRQLVRPSKARMEYDRSVAVASRQVPTAVPLAVGERQSDSGPCESYLITRTLPDTDNLWRFLEDTLPRLPPARRTHLRQRLAAALGELLARMHDAGIVHHDLHAGNLLLQLDAGDQPELFLIDLHAVRFHRPLGWRRSRDNLILLNHWFSLRASRSDRLRFWRHYRRARHRPVACEGPDAASKARELERRTWASNLHFWYSRDRRCLATNRYYQRVRTADAVGHSVRGLDARLLAALMQDPDAVFTRPGVVLLKDSRSSTVAELDLPVDGAPRPVIYKRFRVTTWSDPWAALLRRPAALRSWVFGHGLRERGLPTARPLAVFFRRRRGLRHEGYLIAEKIPEAQELQRYVPALAEQPPDEGRIALRSLVERVARLVRELHRRQLSHRDLKAANLLVSAHGGDVWFIDLVGVRRHRRLSRVRRVQNLARLHASFCRNPAVTRADKLRFLRVYLQWGLRGRAGWKRWWREVAAATDAKVARNGRTGRPLA